MRGAIPPLPNMLSWRGVLLKRSTGETLPLPSPLRYEGLKIMNEAKYNRSVPM
jgi:hypothetical protein